MQVAHWLVPVVLLAGPTSADDLIYQFPDDQVLRYRIKRNEALTYKFDSGSTYTAKQIANDPLLGLFEGMIGDGYRARFCALGCAGVTDMSELLGRSAVRGLDGDPATGAAVLARRTVGGKPGRILPVHADDRCEVRAFFACPGDEVRVLETKEIDGAARHRVVTARGRTGWMLDAALVPERK